MNATIEKEGSVEVLKITIPINERRSTSGKTMVIASTNGNIPISVQYKGKPVILGLNAYYKP
jgi:hypothetical protein